MDSILPLRLQVFRIVKQMPSSELVRSLLAYDSGDQTSSAARRLQKDGRE